MNNNNFIEKDDFFSIHKEEIEQKRRLDYIRDYKEGRFDNPKLLSIIKYLKEGKSNRAISRILNVDRGNVKKLRKIIEEQRKISFKCPCGKRAGHIGGCEYTNKTEKRQKWLERLSNITGDKHHRWLGLGPKCIKCSDPLPRRAFYKLGRNNKTKMCMKCFKECGYNHANWEITDPSGIKHLINYKLKTFAKENNIKYCHLAYAKTLNRPTQQGWRVIKL